MKDILTTFDVAHLCKVDISTVIHWVDTGKLTAYKTPGGHRRIRSTDFMQFLKSYELPIPRGLGGSGMSMLVVSNDAQIRKAIIGLAGQRWPDIKILEAEDGFAAGKLLAEKHPSLVFLDVRLPGIDGLQVCQMIRSDRRLKQTRILVLGKRAADREKILETGVDGYLTNPFDPQKFTRHLEKLLGSVE